MHRTPRGKSAGDLLLDVGPERLEHRGAARLAGDAGDLRQGGGQRDRLEEPLASLPVFIHLVETLFTEYLAGTLFASLFRVSFGRGGLLRLSGVLLARRDRRLALVLALLALAARVLHDLSQNSLALLHLHAEEE